MTWRWRLRSVLSHRQLERDLDDELRSHLEMRADEVGQPEALRRFGNPALIRETMRDTHVSRTLETFWHDVRHGARMLTRKPGFAIAAILTLALAIGANGAIFSALEAAILRPLPFPNPDRLVLIWGTEPGRTRWSVAAPDLDDWRQAASFEQLAAVQAQSVNLTGVDEPGRVIGQFVSPEYFRMLSVQAAQGRTFNHTEDTVGAAGVVVVSYGFWQGRFGGEPSILGHTLILNGQACTIIGVLPQDFAPPIFTSDIWLPSHVYPNYSRDRNQTSMLVMGRLRPGVTIARAQAELDTITRQLASAYPESNRQRGARIVDLHELVVEDLKPSLWTLAGAVGCLMLIACANVAGLLLSQAVGRRQEMSLRGALGAGRLRIVRQLLTESVVLAGAGALLGIAVAYALAGYISHNVDGWPDAMQVKLNWTVLGFILLLTLIAAALFGSAPALMARRVSVEGLRVRGSVTRTRLRSALAAGQVALALVLLIVSGLMTASLKRLLHVDTGFDGSHVLTMEYRLPRNKYPQGAQQTQFHREVVARVRALPGVENAGIVRALPFSGNGNIIEIGLSDRPAPPPSSPFRVRYNTATPTYFDTVRISLHAGRAFRDTDDFNAPRVVLVSDSFVKRYYPNQNPVGRAIITPDKRPAAVVGVVGDSRHDALDEREMPQVYAPNAQDPFIFATLTVRTAGDPLARARDVQRAIWSVDKDQPMWKIRTLDSMVDGSLGPRRVLLTLMGAFSGLALLLAGLGLYGVISYHVSQRTAEFGIRMAMGATAAGILRMVLQQGILLAAAGWLAGLAIAPLFGRALEKQLFGVHPVDITVYATLSAALLGISVIAVLLPAWRATRLDPTRALRAE
jgi:putative ABC transport system permease protein